ncbi:MAG: adenylate/guanylate cyclase domain-containing protein [Mariprofundus sp.]|nr:adenylate/guanylate cyclase domain-containing protein [Mariprofundus sp.]
MVILNIERVAWLASQTAQAQLQVDRLSDELKLPLLSGSSSETAIVVRRFLNKVPTVLAVLIRYPDGRHQTHGSIIHPDAVLFHLSNNQRMMRLSIDTLWYAKPVMYDKTLMGTIGVRFSEQAWAKIADNLTQQILIAAVLVVMFSGLLVFWIAGRMSEPIEMLADAAAKVAEGDYQVQLPVRGNDELSDAVSQFNAMVRGLAHKEELRDVFGRYLNPKLVSEVFEHTDVEMMSHRQEVSVLFADMVQFAAFSEATDTRKVVAVLNQYFEVFHRIISHYGGHVDKYMGDAVMAVFNHPVSDERHVQHAAAAGLAVTLACQKLAIEGEGGASIQFRVGMNCGQAIVGNIGAAQRLEYTVIGDAVNVASRMSGVGDGDALLMSRQSFERLGDDFNFHSMGVHEIKGLSQSIEVGRVQAASYEARQNIERVVLEALSGQPNDV